MRETERFLNFLLGVHFIKYMGGGDPQKPANPQAAAPAVAARVPKTTDMVAKIVNPEVIRRQGLTGRAGRIFGSNPIGSTTTQSNKQVFGASPLF